MSDNGNGNGQATGVLGAVLDVGKFAARINNELAESIQRALHLRPDKGTEPRGVQVLVKAGNDLVERGERLLHIWPDESKASSAEIKGRAAAPVVANEAHAKAEHGMPSAPHHIRAPHGPHRP